MRLKGSVTVDWMDRGAALARMRVLVKRILRRHWVSAGPAGRGRPDRFAIGRGAVGRVGEGGVSASGDVRTVTFLFRGSSVSGMTLANRYSGGAG